MEESDPSVDAEEALDVPDAPGSTQVDWLGEGDPGEQALKRHCQELQRDCQELERHCQELERRGLERRADDCQS